MKMGHNCDVGHFYSGVTTAVSFVNISPKFDSNNVQVHNPSAGFTCQTDVRIIVHKSSVKRKHAYTPST